MIEQLPTIPRFLMHVLLATSGYPFEILACAVAVFIPGAFQFLLITMVCAFPLLPFALLCVIVWNQFGQVMPQDDWFMRELENQQVPQPAENGDPWLEEYIRAARVAYAEYDEMAVATPESDVAAEVADLIDRALAHVRAEYAVPNNQQMNDIDPNTDRCAEFDEHDWQNIGEEPSVGSQQ